MAKTEKEKLLELIKNGCEHTGKYYTIQAGPNKGKTFPVYPTKGDIAAMVYNDEDDKIEMVYKLTLPYKGKPQTDKSSIEWPL